MGGEERGYDGGKKVKGRKRHILVDTEGFVLKAKVHSAKVYGLRGDQDAAASSARAIPSPLSSVVGRGLPRRGQGQRTGCEKTLGWSVDLVERPKKPAPEEVLMRRGRGNGPKRAWR